MTATNMQLLPLAHTLAGAKSWDDFTRSLMLSGKKLPVMPERLRKDNTSVEGCESPVWLVLVRPSAKGYKSDFDIKTETETERGSTSKAANAHFLAYSPSKVIRGVLAVLLEKANSLDSQERINFDFGTYLKACQLERYMSESRGNGIKSVIQKLKAF